MGSQPSPDSVTRPSAALSTAESSTLAAAAAEPRVQRSFRTKIEQFRRKYTPQKFQSHHNGPGDNLDSQNIKQDGSQKTVPDDGRNPDHNKDIGRHEGSERNKEVGRHEGTDHHKESNHNKHILKGLYVSLRNKGQDLGKKLLSTFHHERPLRHIVTHGKSPSHHQFHHKKSHTTTVHHIRAPHKLNSHQHKHITSAKKPPAQNINSASVTVGLFQLPAVITNFLQPYHHNGHNKHGTHHTLPKGQRKGHSKSAGSHHAPESFRRRPIIY